MTLKRHTLLFLAALGSGWIVAGVAAPAMAGDRNADMPANQGPHGFGDPTASGHIATGSMAAPAHVNQGAHGFGDPTASGRVMTVPMPAPAVANRGPHAF